MQKIEHIFMFWTFLYFVCNFQATSNKTTSYLIQTKSFSAVQANEICTKRIARSLTECTVTCSNSEDCTVISWNVQSRSCLHCTKDTAYYTSTVGDSRVALINKNTTYRTGGEVFECAESGLQIYCEQPGCSDLGFCFPSVCDLTISEPFKFSVTALKTEPSRVEIHPNCPDTSYKVTRKAECLSENPEGTWKTSTLIDVSVPCLPTKCQYTSESLPNITRAIYGGTEHTIQHGKKCQSWSEDDNPHDLGLAYPLKFLIDENFPTDGSKANAKNYCRDPDGGGRVWCYNGEGDPSYDTQGERWDNCNIPACKT